MVTKKSSGGSKRRPAAASGTSLVPAQGAGSLVRVPVVGDPDVVRDGDVTMVSNATYLAHGLPVPEADVFFDAGVRPTKRGPWLGEADKVAWRDPATGYECIMLRAHPGGFLGGYVGVPLGHPLYGFDDDAIPADLGIEVHGGVVYARMCQDGPSPQRRVRYESRRICHVAVEVEPRANATDHRVADGHIWWFGFTCDHVTDVAPGGLAQAAWSAAPGIAAHARRAAAIGVAQVYRDDAYVVNEVRNLAAQLRAVADGVPPPPRVGPPLPPASLDVRRSS